MSAAKKQTKQDLENKIAELEAKLTKLATQLEAKPTAAPKPAEVKPSQAKPAEVTKPKGTLPKGFDTKPADAPKPAETKAQPPSTIQAALEDAYKNARMTDFHWYRAHVTGYYPADKTFGSFSGMPLTVDGSVAQSQTYQTPPPKPSRGTLPKGF